MNSLFTFDFQKAIKLGTDKNTVVYDVKDEWNTFGIDFVEFFNKIYYEKEGRNLTDIFLSPDYTTKFLSWNGISIHRLEEFNLWQDYYLNILKGTLASNDLYLVLGVDRNCKELADSIILGSY